MADTKTVNVGINVPNQGEADRLREQSKKKKMIKMNPLYQSTSEIVSVIPEKLKWEDDQMINLDGVGLESLDVSEICHCGIPCLKALVTGISETAAASYIILAWNLLCPGDVYDRIFPMVDITSSFSTFRLDHMSDTIINPTNEQESWIIENDELHLAQGITYISASLIRLITKESINYSKAIPHLMMNFYKFYKKQFPIGNFSVNSRCLEVLRSMYQTDSRLKNSTTGLLYYYDELSTHKGLCRMLYEQHLSYTGLHAFPLFIQAVAKTHLTPSELLSALDCRKTRKSLLVISLLINDYEVKPNEERSRRTYKYARIWDPEMFSSLQTKNCTELVCILAYLNKMVGTQGAGNILDIAMVRNLADETQVFCKGVANNIYRAAMDIDGEDEQNPMFNV
uniref:Nucleoprotein n=1 Tax=Asplenium virus 1 TaxID=2977956 RepID=A0A9N6YIV5_9RHAB|nr:TPA_asm: nucleocapsid protein [Asplenium virus 1]